VQRRISSRYRRLEINPVASGRICALAAVRDVAYPVIQGAIDMRGFFKRSAWLLVMLLIPIALMGAACGDGDDDDDDEIEDSVSRAGHYAAVMK
jgi:hypothetical protein